mgnify:CR=1 FL=1
MGVYPGRGGVLADGGHSSPDVGGPDKNQHAQGFCCVNLYPARIACFWFKWPHPLVVCPFPIYR